MTPKKMLFETLQKIDPYLCYLCLRNHNINNIDSVVWDSKEGERFYQNLLVLNQKLEIFRNNEAKEIRNYYYHHVNKLNEIRDNIRNIRNTMVNYNPIKNDYNFDELTERLAEFELQRNFLKQTIINLEKKYFFLVEQK